MMSTPRSQRCTFPSLLIAFWPACVSPQAGALPGRPDLKQFLHTHNS
jgi:hypothetical protein